MNTYLNCILMRYPGGDASDGGKGSVGSLQGVPQLQCSACRTLQSTCSPPAVCVCVQLCRPLHRLTVHRTTTAQFSLQPELRCATMGPAAAAGGLQ